MRVRRVVGQVIFIDGYSGVAQSQVVQETLDVLVVGIVVACVDDLVKLQVNHVEVGDSQLEGILALVVVLSVTHTSNAHLFENHVVLGQSSRLVSE